MASDKKTEEGYWYTKEMASLIIIAMNQGRDIWEKMNDLPGVTISERAQKRMEKFYDYALRYMKLSSLKRNGCRAQIGASFREKFPEKADEYVKLMEERVEKDSDAALSKLEDYIDVDEFSNAVNSEGEKRESQMQ